MRYYKIKGEGASGFLCPPGHYNHTHSLWEYNGPRGRTEIGIFGLDYIDDEHADPSPEIRAQVERIRKATKLVASEAWVRMVYGYFKTMYLPESGSRNVSDLLARPSNDLPPERHAAVHMTREYFPDHEPRVDLIANPGQGYDTWPYTRCGERVRYEPRFDALTKVTTRMDGQGVTHWTYETTCTNGQPHTIDEAE